MSLQKHSITSTDPLLKNRHPQHVLVVIINYFMAEECERLIQSMVETQQPALKKIVCVDNSCNSEQWQHLTRIKNSILKKGTDKSAVLFEIHENSENIGFGAAINAVMELQLKAGTGFDRALLINPDVNLEKDTIENLIQGSQSCPEAKIWGGVTVNEVAEADGFHAWRSPTLLREIAWCFGLNKILPIASVLSDYRHEHKENSKLLYYPVDVVSGCFLLIDLTLWRELAGFDERFFLYSEEVDLCLRAKKLGASPHVINAAKIRHARGTSTHDLARKCLVVNSKLLYWQKHRGYLQQKIIRYIYALGYFWRGLAFCLLPQRREFANDWFKLSGKLLLNKKLIS